MKSNLSIIHRDDSAIADGNFMSIAPKIFDDLFWSIPSGQDSVFLAGILMTGCIYKLPGK